MVIIATLLAALVFAAVSYDVDDPASRLGGDYPSFYAAGSIVNTGDWQELYSPARQQAQQAGLIDDEGGFLYFSYPPFVAALYGLLALPGYQWSFLIHTFLMLLALAGAIWALSPWLRRTGLPAAALVVVALSFFPVFAAAAGGQNTALSILLFAVAARLDHDDRPVLAGLVAALLLFKPQFGVVIVPLAMVARRWRILAGWAMGAGALFAISTLLMGGNWLTDWWSQASLFRDTNAVANGANFVSIPGFIENLLGVGSQTALLLGYGSAALLGARVALLWWREPDTETLWRWAVAAGAAMAVSPQTLFYDAGLLLLLLVALLPGWRRPVLVVAALAAISWLQVAEPVLGWSPLGPISLGALVAAVVLRPVEQADSAP
jgi:hypothetical protein